MSSRRGLTIAELLVVITTVTVILSGVVVLMDFVFQLNGEANHTTQVVADVGRMAEQFRSDAHQAHGEPIVAADHRSAEFHLSGGKIVTWRIDEPRGLVRTEKVRAAGDRENAFHLPKDTTATLELQAQGATRTISIRIRSPGNGGPRLAIEALAARDRRLALEEEKP